jgi:perosamine synthetase
MDAVVALAEEHNLLVVEDCAQAFVGMQFTGERGADVSMFSFGTIKTTTAFGGAVIRVKNEAIRDEMKRRESRYPARSTAFFLKRLLKYGAVHSLSTPAIYGIAIHTCRGLGGDFDKVITAAIRGFSGGELVSLIRFRPSMPLLGLLHHRLTAVDDAYIELRRLKSERLALALKDVPQLEVRLAWRVVVHERWY